MRLYKHLSAVFFLPFVFMCTSAQAQGWVQMGTSINGIDLWDYTGLSVDINATGNVVAVADPFHAIGLIYPGQVRIFEWNGSQWIQKGLTIEGQTDGENFGGALGDALSLSADGNTIAIGAPGADLSGDDIGLVRVYSWNGSMWVQKGSYLGGLADDDEFGTSVGLSADGNTLIVSAPQHDMGGTNRGAVNVYEWNGASWQPKGSPVYGIANADKFGSSVELSNNGQTLAAGSFYHDAGGFDAGSASVFDWNGSAWIQRGVTLLGDSDNNFFGYSIALDSIGNTIAAGSPNTVISGTFRGKVQVYAWNGSAWVQKGIDIPGKTSGCGAGSSVSLRNDGLVLAIGDAAFGADVGMARIYRWDGSAWIQRGADINGEATGDRAGQSCAVNANGNRIIIGSEEGGPGDEGHARVFEYGSVDVNEITSEKLMRIFPNPVVNELEIKFNTANQKTIAVRICSVDGREYTNEIYSVTNHGKIDIHFLSPGIYIISIDTGNEIIQSRFVKQ